MTPQEDVDAVKSFCEKVIAQNIKGLHALYVDDYGRHSNFQICALFDKHKHLVVRDILKEIRTLAKKESFKIREAFPPKIKYGRDAWGRHDGVFDKYEDNNFMIDIDFKNYNQVLNIFTD